MKELSLKTKFKIGIVSLCIAIFASHVAAPMTVKKSERELVADQIWAEAAVAGDEWFFHVYSSILWYESRFVHNTISYNTDGSYDYGIAQLNSYCWDYDRTHWGCDIRTAAGNARAGAIFFRKLVEQYGGDYYKAALAYNCGAGTVFRGTVPDVTKKYAAKVLARALLSRSIGRD